MSTLGFRIRVWVRRRIARLVVTVLLIGLLAGLVIGLAAGTRRTGSAPDRYTAWAGGEPDLQLLQVQGAPLTKQVAALPGVRAAHGGSFVAAFPVRSDGTQLVDTNPFAGDDRANGMRPVAGRFTDPRATSELVVNRAAAALLERAGVRLGDNLQIAAFGQGQLATNRAFSSGDPPAVKPFPVRWVGTVESPADFEQRVPTIYYSERFLDGHPTVGVVQTFLRVDLAPGADPRAIVRAVREMPGGAGATATGARIVSAESRRAVGYQTSALWIVTAIALVGTAVVVLQLLERSVRRGEDETRPLAAVGLGPRDLAGERAVESFLLVIAALPVVVVTAFLVSGLFPLGALDIFEPHPGRALDSWVVLIGVVALFGSATLAAWAAGRQRRVRAPRSSVTTGRHLTPVGASVPVQVGTRFLIVGPTGARRSLAVLVAGVVGMAGLFGAALVALNVDTIVTTPARWGVDYERLLGNPFIETDHDIVGPVRQNPAVTQLTAAHLGALTIDGKDTPTIGFDTVKGALQPRMITGAVPTHADEIALGAEVARRIGIEVGDRVTALGSGREQRRLRVTGIVVTPDAAGGGAVVPFRTYRALNPDATRNVLFSDLAPDASPREIRRLVAANFTPPDSISTPTSIEALRRVLPAPIILVIVLATLLLVGCAYLLAISVRAERRDLAILKALGAERRQLLAVVHCQATLVAAAILVVGAPAGLLLGRGVVARFTDALGIVPGVDFAPFVLLAVAGATLVAANLLAMVPARRAARASTRALDRDE
jgi:hypothetical protein